MEELIVRLARENPRMGFDKIQGELLKLGYEVDRSTVRNVMRRHHLPPAPERGRSSWRIFLNHYRAQMLACDFFTVETVRLQTFYVLILHRNGFAPGASRGLPHNAGPCLGHSASAPSAMAAQQLAVEDAFHHS